MAKVAVIKEISIDTVKDANWKTWSNELAAMVKDQRGFTIEDFEAKFYELKGLVNASSS